jgi:hypothetical protein
LVEKVGNGCVDGFLVALGIALDMAKIERKKWHWMAGRRFFDVWTGA